MSQQPALRRYILTGAVAAITVTGTLYGAGLKTRQEHQKEQKQVIESSVDSRIDDMEIAKARLMKTRAGLESKIAEIQERRREKTTNADES